MVFVPVAGVWLTIKRPSRHILRTSINKPETRLKGDSMKKCFVCVVQDKAQELETHELEQIRDLVISEISRRRDKNGRGEHGF